MKILIIGNGFVGRSVALIFDGHDIAIWDTGQNRKDPITDGVHAVFICVPTPEIESSGQADISAVEEYVRMFAEHPLVIVKSSVPPTAVIKLCKIKHDIVIMPEFLREKHWATDTLQGKDFRVVGTRVNFTFDRVRNLFKQSNLLRQDIEYVLTTPETAGAYKYYANAFLAMKVVFNHEYMRWVSSLPVSNVATELQTFVRRDGRFGDTHFDAPGAHGWGFSGSCFPKDTKAIAFDAKNALPLIEDVVNRNADLRAQKRIV
jgi:UDPglucose 6-dehydrogenase